MAKCKNCKKLDYVLNSGVPVGRWCAEKCDSPDIERKRSCCKYVPMTNADRIRSMTDAELAEIMDSDCYKLMCFKRGCPHKPNNGVTCKECYLKWLKSEVECEK